jgi:hypothetical protein
MVPLTSIWSHVLRILFAECTSALETSAIQGITLSPPYKNFVLEIKNSFFRKKEKKKKKKKRQVDKRLEKFRNFKISGNDDKRHMIKVTTSSQYTCQNCHLRGGLIQQPHTQNCHPQRWTYRSQAKRSKKK